MRCDYPIFGQAVETIQNMFNLFKSFFFTYSNFFFNLKKKLFSMNLVNSLQIQSLVKAENFLLHTKNSKHRE